MLSKREKKKTWLYCSIEDYEIQEHERKVGQAVSTAVKIVTGDTHTTMLEFKLWIYYDFRLPVNNEHPEKRASGGGIPPPMRESQTKLPAPGLNLVQSWFWALGGSKPADWRCLCLSNT